MANLRMTTAGDRFVEEVGADGKTIIRREKAMLPTHENEDGCPVCPACGCADLDGNGVKRTCNNCGKIVFVKEHRGPKCEKCGAPLEVTNTFPWRDGSRERRYRCSDYPRCRETVITIETDPFWKRVSNAN